MKFSIAQAGRFCQKSSRHFPRFYNDAETTLVDIFKIERSKVQHSLHKKTSCQVSFLLKFCWFGAHLTCFLSKCFVARETNYVLCHRRLQKLSFSPSIRLFLKDFSSLFFCCQNYGFWSAGKFWKLTKALKRIVCYRFYNHARLADSFSIHWGKCQIEDWDCAQLVPQHCAVNIKSLEGKLMFKTQGRKILKKNGDRSIKGSESAWTEDFNYSFCLFSVGSFLWKRNWWSDICLKLSS